MAGKNSYLTGILLPLSMWIVFCYGLWFRRTRRDRRWSEVTAAIFGAFKISKRAAAIKEILLIVFEWYELTAYAFLVQGWPQGLTDWIPIAMTSTGKTKFVIFWWIVVGFYLLFGAIILLGEIAVFTNIFPGNLKANILHVRDFFAAYVYQVYLGWLLMPALNYSLNMLSCWYAEEASSIPAAEMVPTTQTFPVVIKELDLACWSGIHSFYAIVSAGLTIILVYGAFWHAAVKDDHNPNFYSLPRFDLSEKLMCIIIAMLAAFLEPRNSEAFVAIVMCLVFIILIVCVYFQPYLGKNKEHLFNNARVAAYAGALWALIIGLAVAVRDDPSDYTPFWVYLGGVVPIMALAWCLNNIRATHFKR